VIHRIVVLLAAMVGGVCFVWCWLSGGDILYAAFAAAASFFGAAIVLLFAARGITRVLFSHLNEKRTLSEMMREKEREKEAAKRKPSKAA
jgi:hypothetical protein